MGGDHRRAVVRGEPEFCLGGICRAEDEKVSYEVLSPLGQNKLTRGNGAFLHSL